MSPWCARDWASRWSRGWAEPLLPDGVVAVVARDPVPRREILALHRRSMAESPAVAAVLAALTRA